MKILIDYIIPIIVTIIMFIMMYFIHYLPYKYCKEQGGHLIGFYDKICVKDGLIIN